MPERWFTAKGGDFEVDAVWRLFEPGEGYDAPIEVLASYPLGETPEEGWFEGPVGYAVYLDADEGRIPVCEVDDGSSEGLVSANAIAVWLRLARP